MTPSEQELRSFLGDESEHVDAKGSFAAAVISRKRRSDRRRLLAGAVAAALAVAVPVVWSNHGGRGAPVPVGTSRTAPTSTAAPTTSRSPGPAVSAIAFLGDAAAVGAPVLSATATVADPGVPYAARGVFHDGSAPTVRGPVAGGFASFARLDHGGYIAQADSGKDQKVYIVDRDGTARVLAGATSYVVSDDGSRIAWRDGNAGTHPGEGVIHLADSRGTELFTVKVDAAPSALVGDRLYAIRLAGPDYAGESVRIDLDSGRRTAIRGNVLDVNAAAGLALALDLPPSEPDPNRPADKCYRVLDVTADTPVTRLSACGDVTPDAFSPDGRYLVGNRGSVVIDAATGQVVLDGPGRTGLDVRAGRMTDDGAALVMAVWTSDQSHSGLVRCELDGRCTQVGGPSVAEPGPDDTDSPRGAYAVSRN